MAGKYRTAKKYAASKKAKQWLAKKMAQPANIKEMAKVMAYAKKRKARASRRVRTRVAYSRNGTPMGKAGMRKGIGLLSSMRAFHAGSQNGNSIPPSISNDPACTVLPSIIRYTFTTSAVASTFVFQYTPTAVRGVRFGTAPPSEQETKDMMGWAPNNTGGHFVWLYTLAPETREYAKAEAAYRLTLPEYATTLAYFRATANAGKIEEFIVAPAIATGTLPMMIRPGRLSVRVQNVSALQTVNGSIRVAYMAEGFDWAKATTYSTNRWANASVAEEAVNICTMDPRARSVTAATLLQPHEYSMAPINGLAYATFDNFNEYVGYADNSNETAQLKNASTFLTQGSDKGATGTLLIHFPAQTSNFQTYELVIRSHDVCKFPLNTTLSQLHRPSAATNNEAWNAMAAAYQYVAQNGITAAQGAAVTAAFA